MESSVSAPFEATQMLNNWTQEINVTTHDLVLNQTNVTDVPYIHSSKALGSNLHHIIDKIVIPLVFAFGIFGNSISLAVFNQKCLSHNVGVIEKSATTGLITLALSDLLFCLVGFPALVFGNIAKRDPTKWINVVSFYYDTYKPALLNIFLLSSTWLIMLISAERCLAICYPFVARDLITVRRTSIVHTIVFIVSFCLNLPLFYAYKIERTLCAPNAYCYYPVPSWFFKQSTHAGAHFIVWSIFGTFLPLAILVFCNVNILKSIYRRHNASSNANPESQQILMKTTWILITMVCCFIVFVCPSIFLQFLYRMGYASNDEHNSVTNLVANLLQAIKFSGNFLLYCLLHKRFREAMAAMRCSSQNPTNGYTVTRYTTTEA